MSIPKRHKHLPTGGGIYKDHFLAYSGSRSRGSVDITAFDEDLSLTARSAGNDVNLQQSLFSKPHTHVESNDAYGQILLICGGWPFSIDQ